MDLSFSVPSPTRQGRRNTTFAPSSAASSDLLDDSGYAVTLEPGTALFEAGAKAATLYYVVSGQLKAERSGSAPHKTAIGVFGRGDVLGFSLDETLPYAATATEPTKLYGYPSSILALPDIQKAGAAEIVTRRSLAPMASILALHAICRSAKPTPRIANYLLTLFDRHGEHVAGAEVAELPAASADMADRLGISASIVRSSLCELTMLGVVMPLSGCWLRLCDRDRLENMALNAA